MTLLIILFCLILIIVVAVQIGRLTELANKIRGEEAAQFESNRWNGTLSLVFLVVFLGGTIISSGYYGKYMLGFGPWVSASEHGGALDSMFKWTLFFTGVVFVLTHIALFWFAWKYRGRKGHKARFLPHNDNLEIIWTAVPAIVMTFLVIKGLDAWNDVMADVQPDEEYIEMEATGYQWGWMLRYPGPDGKLGARDYTLINSGNNPLGQDWTDVKNLDDFHPTEVVLPVGKKVRVRITSRDVLHNFYLPHFRVKMDAVPGMPTYFTFTPKYTTEEYRQLLGVKDNMGNPKYPEWYEIDSEDPDGRKKFQTFNFELACAELCGRGHYSMRKIVRIVSEEEFQRWADEQQSWYLLSVRNTDDDPYKGQMLTIDVEETDGGDGESDEQQTENADENPAD